MVRVSNNIHVHILNMCKLQMMDIPSTVSDLGYLTLRTNKNVATLHSISVRIANT